MNEVKIYHNARCSKSRQALQILLDHGFDPVIVDYLKRPLRAKELTILLKQLGKQPRDIMRKNEELYKSLHLDNAKLTSKELINVLVENPILIERPIVVVDNKAIIARPPEKVLELI